MWLFSLEDPVFHPCFKDVDDIRMFIDEIVIFVRIMNKIIEFNRWLEVEVRFKRDDEFPFGGPPAVFTHPRTFCDVEFTLIGGYLAVH